MTQPPLDPAVATGLADDGEVDDGDGEVDGAVAEPGRGSGPVAVVTGASRGIGRHIADALEDAGYAVERGSTAIAPLTDQEALTAWVDEIVERHGRVDVLVNNAGVVDHEVDIFASDPDEWWAVQEVNVRGAYLMTWLVGRQMLHQGGGRIINLNSGAALRPGLDASAYNVSKTALARITGSSHLAGWARGIRAFDLMPGVVRTEMTLGMQAHVGRTEWTSPEVVTELVLGLAGGDLDAWSGRLVRAGADTVASLLAHGEELSERDRTLALIPYAPDDPLA